MSRTLTHHLQSLHESHRSTLTLIQELQSLPSSDSETYRVELASEIHDTLKEQEDTLDLLRQEIDDSPRRPSSRRISNSQRESDRERNVDLVERLTEDLKSARAKFRRAQLSAKRNADEAKRKEREQLFKRSHEPDENGEVAPQPQRRHVGQQLTQEELARNASEDVTRALRRTHALLQSNLSQSQFAQQTLDESQDALKGLAESYGGTTDLLKNSRGLVGQLVRSNKSDTWYLQTAFYMLAITIAWLFFRRLLYGPLWWLVWQPLKLLWWFTFMALGGMGFGGEKGVEAISNARAMSTSAGTSMMSGSGVNSRGVPTNPPGVHRSVQLPAKGGGWAGGPPAQAPTMVGKVGRMMDGSAEQQGTNVDDIPEEERRRQAEQPRNPKKRMMEVDVEKERGKDEL
jgi:Sec20